LARPDLARIRLRVNRMAREPAQAFDAATRVVGTVRQVLRAHGIDDESVQESRLGLQSMQHWGPNNESGYLCSATFAVESADLDGVQALLVDLVGAGAHEIDGLDFDVADTSELHARARRAAVANARTKAEQYAAEARVRLGAVVGIEDVVRTHRGGYGVTTAAGSTPAPRDLAPGVVTVTASVVVTFAVLDDA
jgi:uncharacterized protein YggE